MTPNPTSAPAPQEQLERAKKWLSAEHYPDVQIEYPTTDGFFEMSPLSMIIAAYAKADRLRLAEEAERESDALVETNGGLRNTIAMEAFDKGYDTLTALQREIVDQRAAQLEAHD